MVTGLPVRVDAEGAINVTAMVDLVEAGGPAWPRSTDRIVGIGSGQAVGRGMAGYIVDIMAWMGELYNCRTDFDAYQLLTQISQVPTGTPFRRRY